MEDVFTNFANKQQDPAAIPIFFSASISQHASLACINAVFDKRGQCESLMSSESIYR
jgi:hypothetical protein